MSFLSIATIGCSSFTTSGDVIITPTAVTTSRVVEDEQSPEDASFFHISKSGNNTDGKSWDTAWNELDQIQWEEVKPGDTIVIAGGEYHTQLDVKKSGVPGLPITITTNGKQVVFDGQRPMLPYCGQTNYTPIPGDDAIDLENQSHIVIDGRDWSGIVIRNHLRGIKMQESASNIIVRNVEIHDNGYSRDLGSDVVAPDGPGVRLGGSEILFERVIIHDNGQDAFQVGWGVWNFTLRNSWLYNSREHPVERGKAFNYCSHTDGIQIYGGGVQGPVVIEDSIIGPSFTQGIIISSTVIVDNVVIKNTLFVGSDNAGIIISDEGQTSNWTLQNVTIVQDASDDRSWSVKLNGNGHRIRDSIFWGGPWGIGVFNWSEAVGNFNWSTPDEYDVAVEMDPMFVDSEYGLVQGEGFADFDFTIQNPEIPPGVGSSITSVTELLDR
ncbi:MAG: right-handed parallel beta-helix repeat-containing protein [Chloroflexota bacterium]